MSNIAGPLKNIVERIETLQTDKKAIADDITDLYKEAKGNGLDVKTIREVIKLRKLDQAKREEQEHLRDVYLQALGLLDLGKE